VTSPRPDTLAIAGTRPESPSLGVLRSRTERSHKLDGLFVWTPHGSGRRRESGRHIGAANHRPERAHRTPFEPSPRRRTRRTSVGAAGAHRSRQIDGDGASSGAGVRRPGRLPARAHAHRAVVPNAPRLPSAARSPTRAGDAVRARCPSLTCCRSVLGFGVPKSPRPQWASGRLGVDLDAPVKRGPLDRLVSVGERMVDGRPLLGVPRCLSWRAKMEARSQRAI
jgi:hypothetical protein